MGWPAARISVSSTSPPPGLCTPRESPCWGAPLISQCIQFEGEESGKLDREAAAASSQAVQYAPADLNACSSGSESGSTSRSVYHSVRKSSSVTCSFVEPGSQLVRHSAQGRKVVSSGEDRGSRCTVGLQRVDHLTGMRARLSWYTVATLGQGDYYL
jgi:hypothetical protein